MEELETFLDFLIGLLQFLLDFFFPGGGFSIGL